MSLMYGEDSRLKDQVGLLVRAAHSSQESVQELAIVQLSVLVPKAVPYICAALSNLLAEAKRLGKAEKSHDEYPTKSDPEIGINGLLRALGIVADPSTGPNITEGLPRPSAVEALSKISTDETLSILIDRFPFWAKKDKSRYRWNEGYSLVKPEFIREVFARFGDRGSKALVDLLERGDPLTQEIISDVLGVTGDSKMVPALVNALKAGQAAVKLAALESLRKLNARETVPFLMEELFKTEDYLRKESGDEEKTREREARRWRGKTAEYDEMSELTKNLDTAISELGTLADWIKVAFHPRAYNINLNEINSKILGSGEEAVPYLTKLLQDPDKQTQRAAAEMIAKIKEGATEEPDRRF